MSQFINGGEVTEIGGGALGVLLVNLGTPEAPETPAVRRYLAEFLADPRVVETPRWLWWLILNGVILRIRPPRSAKAYRTVWGEDGSPLLSIGRAQAGALQDELDRRLSGPIHVELAMRYGQPSIASGIDALVAKGARRLLVLALYPQYSATTTASVFDAVSDRLQQYRWMPELRFINEYWDEPGYIAALADSVREHWAAHGRKQRLVMSFHGVPKRYISNGDPYYAQCKATASQLAAVLSLKDDDWQLVFQSRVGREEWLQPYCDKTMASLPGEGVKSVDVICPGFAADCLETLEEIAEENREIFVKAGGESFSYIPALNARDDHISALADVACRHVLGWPEAVTK